MNALLRLVILLITVALLAGLFIGLRPEAPPVPAERREAQPLAVDFEVRDGRRHSGPAVVRATQGREIAITVVSDRDDELHLHGYDRTLPLQAGQPASLRFRAEAAGRFELELHARHRGLAVIEVLPR